MVEAELRKNPWMHTTEAHDLAEPESTVEERKGLGFSASQAQRSNDGSSDVKLGIGERALSAAGAAFLSAIIVNPLDVAKVNIQQIKEVCMCVLSIFVFFFFSFFCGFCVWLVKNCGR